MELLHSPNNAGVWLYHAYGGVRCIVVSALSVTCMEVSGGVRCMEVSGGVRCLVVSGLW